MFSRHVSFGTLVALALFAALPQAIACNEKSGGFPGCDPTGTANLIEENDSFIDHSDKHYTQGLRVSYASGEQAPGDPGHWLVQGIADYAMLPEAEPGRLRYALSFGQSLFTPEDLVAVRPDPRDRPYAGWLYGSLAAYRETARHLDRAEVTLGLVGPGAGGEFVQNTWHSEAPLTIFRGAHANGWSSQLRDEPGLVLSEERKWRFAGTSAGLEFDALPEANIALGNIFTYAAGGGMVRVGHNLDVDWGPPRVQPALMGSDFVNGRALARGPAWYIFIGGEARLIARNIFLDGNSFERSAHVTKEPLVADFTGGLAGYISAVRLTLTYTRRTREFTTQGNPDEFLSITLGFDF